MEKARNCQNCGSPLPADRYAHRKHCNDRCRKQGFRKNFKKETGWNYSTVQYWNRKGEQG